MAENNILPSDRELIFPEFVILKASAGTGKTRALTLRFTQFLLSERVKHNEPNQILAITFTRNATREMKERIISWLKKCYFLASTETEDRDLQAILKLVSVEKERLKSRAEEILNKILKNYSDFQVTTIDSFMTSIFKASAVELGINPAVEITLETRPVIAYAFSRLMKKVRPGQPESQLFLEICRHLKEMRVSDEAYIWDPAGELESFFLDLNKKLAGANRRAVHHDLKALNQQLKKLEKEFTKSLENLNLKLKTASSIPKNSRLWNYVNKNRPGDWLDYDFKIINRHNLDPEIHGELKEIKDIIDKYREVQARTFFQPHLKIYDQFLEILNQTKRERGLVFLEDIHCHLANYLDEGVVPDVYFSLGSEIYHYLIDEFQDTSPLQWQNLYPLVENALSQGGSLFLVGDTKQAIYGFREADYRIMVNLILKTDGFASVEPRISELQENWRSRKEVLEWVSKIFPEGIRNLRPEGKKWPEAELWKQAGSQSFLDDFQCLPSPALAGSQGYVEINLLDLKKMQEETTETENDDSDRNQEDSESPEKREVQELILDLHRRGYNYSDIAVLAYENDNIKQAAVWLNELGIPFVPYSALDIRSRPVIREILAFLQFLDYPLDELNLAVFLCGQLFQERLRRDGFQVRTEEFHEFIIDHRLSADSALYISFRQKFPLIWESYFENFFKTVGYLPLYDLVTRFYSVFRPLELFPQEEGSLIKLLEVIKNFEGQGKSNLRDFIKFSADDTDEQNVWTIDIPESIDAVRLMTIHKAKGLGFPVVILLLYRDRIRPETFYLRETHPEREGKLKGPKEVEILKLNASTAAAHPDLKEAYESYRQRERVNKLNILYVALTRAREELYVIGVKKTNEYPFNFLESVLNCRAPVRLTSASTRPRRVMKTPHLQNLTDLRFLPVPEFSPASPRRPFNYYEKKRGQLIHRLLASIEYLEGEVKTLITDIISGSWAAEFSPEELQEAARTVEEFLSRPEVACYFLPRPGRTIRRETELVDASGRLFRADRLVIDPERVTVIDFKAGRKDSENKESHVQQLRRYVEIISQIYPARTVEGLLMYYDLKEVERIS